MGSDALYLVMRVTGDGDPRPFLGHRTVRAELSDWFNCRIAPKSDVYEAVQDIVDRIRKAWGGGEVSDFAWAIYRLEGCLDRTLTGTLVYVRAKGARRGGWLVKP